MISSLGNWIGTFLWLIYFAIVRPSNNFTFQGESYPYLYRYNNFTFLNERAIEIPIVKKIWTQNKQKNILEVGNVLSQYYQVQHDVLDKYEKAEGVINQDVVDYRPVKRYDLIFCISTLEHVGWDEQPKDPDKVVRAIRNLKGLLNERGEIIVTIPLGYNSEIDDLIRKGEIQFTDLHYLKRISWKNRWIEANSNEIKDSTYNSHYPRAEAVVFGRILNSDAIGTVDFDNKSQRKIK